MGNSESSDLSHAQRVTGNEVAGHVIIRRGMYGLVYRETATGNVMKRGRTGSRTTNVDDQFWRNVRFLDFVSRHKEFAHSFAHLIKYSVIESAWRPPLPPDVSDEETKQRVLAQYAEPFEYRLTMTDVGKPLSTQKFWTTNAPPVLRYHVLLQILRIVRLLQTNGVVHADLHEGNFLVHGKTVEGYPLLALIDYDDTFFRGDKPYEALARNHLMLAQVSMIMSNINQTHACIEEHRKTHPASEEAASEKVIKQIHAELPEFAQSADTLIKAAGVDPDSDFVVALHYDIVKARYPDLHRRICSLPATAPVHTWFPAEDLEFVYKHVHSIDEIIAHFEQKKAEAKK